MRYNQTEIRIFANVNRLVSRLLIVSRCKYTKKI